MQAKGWWFLSLAIATATFTAKADSGGAKLLDDTIRNPGGWSQMCSIPPPIGWDVPFPLYSLAVPRFSSLSSQDILRLAANREEVVPAIIKRLHDLDLSKHTLQSIRSVSPTNSPNQDARALPGVLLQTIMELKAVETLPELVRIEADLNQLIEKAEKDTSAPLPFFDLETQGQGLVIKGQEPTPQQQRLFPARVSQRELLSVMATLLRQQKFQPLLSSDIEAHYALLLKSQKDAYPVSYTAPAWGEIKEHYMPYTPELRREILEFASNFLKQSQDKQNPASSVAGK